MIKLGQVPVLLNISKNSLEMRVYSLYKWNEINDLFKLLILFLPIILIKTERHG